MNNLDSMLRLLQTNTTIIEIIMLTERHVFLDGSIFRTFSNSIVCAFGESTELLVDMSDNGYFIHLTSSAFNQHNIYQTHTYV